MKTIYTIGSARKPLQQFIELLRRMGVKEIIDIRLRNSSQLIGWSKQPDFEYLLNQGFGIKYQHGQEFAPTEELLERYRNTHNWEEYEAGFKRLIEERQLEAQARLLLEKDGPCLLCTEPEPDKCHRRIVAEYLAGLMPDIEIRHL